MHRKGIFHRDLKLLNIFVTDSSDYPKVKIGDLGMACQLKDGEHIQKQSGTFAFMSPELILKQPNDFKSDVWSLGIVLYSIMTGTHPFEKQNETKKMLKKNIAFKVLRFEGEIWQHISPECQDLLLHLLDKDSESRFSID